MKVSVGRVVGATLAVVVVWLALGAWQAVSAAADLRLAQTHATDGRSLALEGEIAEAASELGDAAVSFDNAHRRLTSVALLPWRAVPPAGRNLGVLAELSSAGARTARAGHILTAALDRRPGGAADLAPSDGALPVATYEAMARPLRDAHGLLAAAESDVAATHGVPVVGLIARARDTIDDTVTPAADATRRAAQLAPVLPDFLGAHERRRYLFVAQNPAELRGTGGFIGAFSIVIVEGGRIRFSDFGEIHELPDFPASQVPAPTPDFARRYTRHGGAGFWHNINMTPDFPTAARAMQRLYEKGTGQALDGVIAADPFAFQSLLEAGGPVDIPGFGTVGADEVVDVVSHRAHAEIANSAARKRLLGAVAIGAFEGVLRGGADPLAVAGALADAAGDGHLLLRSEHPDEQAAFVATGLAGALPQTDGDFLAVIANAGSAAKLDYYIDRTVTYDVRLAEDGSLDGRASVAFHNTAPGRGVSRRVIGPNAAGLEAGEQRLIVAFYSGERSEARDFTRTSGERPLLVERELGRPVYSTVLDVPSRTTQEVAVTWERPRGWQRDGAGGRYQLTVHDQPTLQPTTFELRLQLPPDMVPTRLPDGMERLADGTLRYRDDDGGGTSLVVELASTRQPDLWARISDWLSRPLIRF